MRRCILREILRKKEEGVEVEESSTCDVSYIIYDMYVGECRKYVTYVRYQSDNKRKIYND